MYITATIERVTFIKEKPICSFTKFENIHFHVSFFPKCIDYLNTPSTITM